ncbi:MAG: hypothetical protein AB1403_25790, partial [Candidatus Riflebacteria bacterium]
MMITTKTKMAVAGGRYNINAEIAPRQTSTNTSVPSGMTGGSSSGGSTDLSQSGSQINKYGLSFNNSVMTGVTNPLNYLQGLMGPGKLNVIPDIGGMSTNPFALAVTLALKPMVDKVVPPSIAKAKDCFEKWEMPYMGTGNWLYTIPTTGTGASKTHFFGYGGLYPTLTKEIEGNVLKKYRQWKMCVIGMSPVDRLLSYGVIFPIWYTQEVLTKYDYNLEPLKANDESGNPDLKTYEYDPTKLENMAPNLYTLEQYAKKATYYYEDYQAFMEDLPNRMSSINGRKVFILNGITYVAGSIGEASNPFCPPDSDGTLNVCGRGMIVCSGNFYLGCNIKTLDRTADEPTVFTLMVRNGGLLVLQGDVQREVEGSIYTDKGMYVNSSSSMHVIGNWVTNQFNKAA